MKPISQSVENAVNTLAEKLETLMVKKECWRCGNTFQTAAGPMAMYAKTCQTCIDLESEQAYEKKKQDEIAYRQIQWHKFCPPDYLICDRSKLPTPEKLDEVLTWEFGPKGMVLFGDTGRGKTRCAWQILRRELFSGRTIACMDSSAGLGYAALYSESANMVKKWFDKIVSIDLLLLDDVFKNKLTDSFEGIIFTLVDQRIQHHRPTIITSNDTGATLAGRMTQDRANPLLRRLREHCIQINF